MGECVICLQSDPVPVQSGCACRGDAGWAHVACLIEKAVAQRRQRGSSAWTTCQTCMQEFTGAIGLALAEAWGEREPSNTNAQSLIGTMMRRHGRYADAERIHRGVVTALHVDHDDDDPGMLRSMGNLAVAIGSRGKHAEAEAIQRAIIASSRLSRHDDLATRTNLSTSLCERGDYAEAERILRNIVCERTLTQGGEHIATLQAKCNLGVALAAQHMYDEAGTLLHEVATQRRRTLGDEHSETLIAIGNLASLCFLPQGRYIDAERMQREVISVQRRTLGEEHPHTLMTGHNLALSLWGQGKCDDARSHLEAVYAVRMRTHGPSHPDTAESARWLRHMRTGLGDRTRACAAADCTRNADTDRCVRCGVMLYCSRACRLADAKAHKRSCSTRS